MLEELKNTLTILKTQNNPQIQITQKPEIIKNNIYLVSQDILKYTDEPKNIIELNEKMKILNKIDKHIDKAYQMKPKESLISWISRKLFGKSDNQITQLEEQYDKTKANLRNEITNLYRKGMTLINDDQKAVANISIQERYKLLDKFANGSVQVLTIPASNTFFARLFSPLEKAKYDFFNSWSQKSSDIELANAREIDKFTGSINNFLKRPDRSTADELKNTYGEQEILRIVSEKVNKQPSLYEQSIATIEAALGAKLLPNAKPEPQTEEFFI